MRTRYALFVAFFATSTPGWSQSTTSSGPEIYAKVAESVLLIEVRNDKNEAIGRASAFVIGPKQLLTNAHAVSGASIWVKIGPLSIPASVQRTDQLNDLALLQLEAELSLPILSLASSDPPPGARIFALGNPKGLERSISDGLVAATRKIESRSFLQISAPISPGSSGGPIVNDRGEVVAVAVAVLKDAQNVNFGVPASVVARFLANETTVTPTAEIASIKALVDRRNSETWSEEEDSAYQKLAQQVRTAAALVIPRLESEDTMWDLFSTLAGEADLRRAIADRAMRLWPKNATAFYNAADSTEDMALTETTEEAQATLYREAEQFASKALTLAGVSDKRKTLLLLGRLQTNLDDRRHIGIATLQQAIGGAKDSIAQQAALQLFYANKDLKRFPEARKWFEYAAQIGPVNSFQHASHATVLESLTDHASAANAYTEAARILYRHHCSASAQWAMADNTDLAISSARQCLDKATNAPNGEPNAAWAHRLLAMLLLERGVIDQAINHARQAIAIEPDHGHVHSTLAGALLRAERWSEAEIAARAAIRLTDGREALMHFRLGNALFGLERWSEAATAFEQAARMDQKDTDATYNIALCNMRQRYYRDAARWFEETLRRDPNHPEATEIRQRIQELRSR